jgi:hypothetical protein
MTNSLRFGDTAFDFEKTNLYGILEPHGRMTWYVELFPPGEDDYIMFNALVFDRVFAPRGLGGLVYKGDTRTIDLYEHTVRVNGEDRFLESIDMRFGDWDKATQRIALHGKGMIEAEHGQAAIPCTFEAMLPFEGLSIFETSREAAHRFLQTHLPAAGVALHFEQVPSGLQAVFSGQF